MAPRPFHGDHAMRPPLFLLLGLAGLVLLPAHRSCAQLDLRIETPKASYLQYASIPLNVRMRNLGGTDLVLGSSSGRPWLEMIVQSTDGLVLPPERPLAPPEVTLKPGESRVLPLDLSPHYLVREPGGYQVRASVRLPSGQTLLTESLMFLVGRGEVVWSAPRGEGAEEKRYTLLKFYEDPAVGLYLRIEIPAQNLVYPALRLGSYVALTPPTAEFDSLNHLHVLYPVGAGTHRLTVVNEEGRVLREEERAEQGIRPMLRRAPDGLVDVQGGAVILPAHLREKLSTLQARAGAAQAE